MTAPAGGAAHLRRRGRRDRVRARGRHRRGRSGWHVAGVGGLRRAGVAVVAVVLAAAVATGCAPPAKSRLNGLAPTSAKPGDIVVDPTIPVVPAHPTTAPTAPPTSRVQAAARQNGTCAGTARDFVPAQIPGYNLAASTDVSNTLKANDQAAKYVDSLGAIVATRPDGKGALVVVAKFNPAGADFVKTSADTAFMFLAGVNAVQKVDVDGLLAYTGTTAQSKTAYAVQYCNNVFVVVTASDPAIALDAVRKVLAGAPKG